MIVRRTLVLAAAVLAVQVDSRGEVMTRLQVTSEVGHRYAVTEVTAAITNTRSKASDVKLRMTLPWAAYVTTLTIERGGRNYTTIIREKRREERKTQVTPSESDTGSVKPKAKTTHTFRASANVKGNQSAVFYLRYEELLQRVKGRYTHKLYLRPANDIRELDVKVRISESENITDLQTIYPSRHFDLQTEELYGGLERRVSPTEIIVTYRDANITGDFERNEKDDDNANVVSETEVESKEKEQEEGDEKREDEGEEEREDEGEEEREDEGEEEREGLFSVSYDVDRQPDGGEIQIRGGYFVHYFCPEGLPKLPTHTVFVLDVSGSMYDFGKLDQLKLAMESILHSMKPDDSFEVLVFSTRVKSLGVFRASSRDVEKGVTKIKRLQAMGGTNFNEALLKAVIEMNNYNETTAAKQVVFLTDGKPNLGETKPELLRRNIREANIHSHPIFALAFGEDADMRLLRQVSTDNRGFTRKIDAHTRPADDLRAFFEEISTPLITDVDVMYLDDEVEPNSVVRQGTSTYYSGDEVVLAGRLVEGATQVQPIITGQGRSGPLQFRVSRVSNPEEEPERDNYVERLWAYLTVQDLLSMQEVVEDTNLRAEMRARALDIAVRFQFLTKLTSLDIVESDDPPSGYKSPAQHRKSNSMTIRLPNVDQDLTLLSAAEFAKTLPAPLNSRVNTVSRSRFSFGDNDPHFVVQVPGVNLPLCFDVHGQNNDIFSLVRDHRSGIIVNGEVTSSADRPELTYFTKIFISLGKVNFTVTPELILIDCLDDSGKPKVNQTSTSLWPFKKSPRRRIPRVKGLRRRRKVRRQSPKRGRGRGRKQDSKGATTSHKKGRRLFPKGKGSRGKGRSSRFKRDLRHPHEGRYPFHMRTERDGAHPHAQRYPGYRHPHSSYGGSSHGMAHKPRQTPTLDVNKPGIPTSPNTSTPSPMGYPSHEMGDTPLVDAFALFNGSALQPTSEDGEIDGEDLAVTGEDSEEGVNLMEECSDSFAWMKAAGRRFGRVVVALRNRRKLEIIIGDVDAHFVVTRSKNRHGQQFLGFYIEEQKVLSPNATGIIGQFAFKTVGTLGSLEQNNMTRNITRVKLAVMQPGPQKKYKVSHVNAIVSARRSLLHKTHITCLFIRNHGRGLLAGHSEDYLRPCLSC